MPLTPPKLRKLKKKSTHKRNNSSPQDWVHPNLCGLFSYINRLREKLKLDQSDSACQIVDEATQRGNGYRLTYSAK